MTKKLLTSSIPLFLSLFALSTLPAPAEERPLLTPAEMAKKLAEQQSEESGEEENNKEVHEWPEGLSKDLPLYPGVEHHPVFMGFKGYYRWNIQAPTSDRAKIIEILRQGATNGWTVTGDQKQSENTHLLQFSKEGQNVVVNVSNDGTETKTVYYEFMTDEFKESVSKGR